MAGEEALKDSIRGLDVGMGRPHKTWPPRCVDESRRVLFLPPVAMGLDAAAAQTGGPCRWQRRLGHDRPRLQELPSSSSLPKHGTPQGLPLRCLRVDRHRPG